MRSKPRTQGLRSVTGNKPRIHLVLIGCGLLCLAGCGSAGPRLSDAAFRLQANRICAAFNHAPSHAGALVLERRSLRDVRRGLTELGRLRPPAQDKQSYEALLAGLTRFYRFQASRPSPAQFPRDVIQAVTTSAREALVLKLQNCARRSDSITIHVGRDGPFSPRN